MASTLLNSVIQAPIYQINSNTVIDRTLYPSGMPMIFGTGGITIQPNSGSKLSDYQAGGQPGGALLYSRIKSAATGDTVFYSNLTVAQIISSLAT